MSISMKRNRQGRKAPEPVRPQAPRSTFDSGTAAKAKETIFKVVSQLGSPEEGNFQYQPIEPNDEIRILRILPGNRAEPIRCALIPSAMASPENLPSNSKAESHKYEALSYWWGTGEADQMILIHKPNFNKKKRVSYSAAGDSFYIRRSLKSALEQLRSKTEEVDIWVDAMCINQNDAKEKAAQVSRMHEIYAEADTVCIWLGDGNDETKDTFQFLKEILDPSKLDSLIKLGIESGHQAEKWELMTKLLKNRWFSRRWVIQEITLAKKATVCWGAEEMLWSDFADAIALFMMKHDEIQKILGKKSNTKSLGDARALGANTLVEATNNLFRKSPDGKIQQRLLSLETLVSCFLLAFEASDPRDTIYAVLSIAKDTSFKSDNRISPNYDKSLIDVCADFMDYCIQQSESLDILCRHWAPVSRGKTSLGRVGSTSSTEKVPTWIPSIEGYAFGKPEEGLQGRKNGDSFVGSLERQNQQHYNATAGLRPCWKFKKVKKSTENKIELSVINGRSQPVFRKYTGTLYVKGQRLGEICRVSGRVTGGIIQEEALDMGDWPRECNAEKVPDQLWRTLVADRGPHGINAPSWYHRACLHCLAHVDANGDLNTNELIKGAETSTTIVSFLERVQRVICNRKFFQTGGTHNNDMRADTARPVGARKQLFGLAPPAAKEGDHVCILYGCSVPILLRQVPRKSDEKASFEVVGECYVYGMMDGEAVPLNARPENNYPDAENFRLV